MTDPSDPVREARELKPWPLGAYAPGGYMCRCLTCGKDFEGDKRAVSCLECAVIRVKDALAEAERLRGALSTAREGLAIAASWASRKPDSQRARDKIKAGLDAIRTALRPRPALAAQVEVPADGEGTGSASAVSAARKSAAPDAQHSDGEG